MATNDSEYEIARQAAQCLVDRLPKMLNLLDSIVAGQEPLAHIPVLSAEVLADSLRQVIGSAENGPLALALGQSIEPLSVEKMTGNMEEAAAAASALVELVSAVEKLPMVESVEAVIPSIEQVSGYAELMVASLEK